MDLIEFLRWKTSGKGNAFDGRPIEPHNPDMLPRTIYMFWDKGLDSAPDLVKLCADSWQLINPDWEFVLLDSESASSIVDRSELPHGLIPAHYADLLRMKLLRDKGGVWADASLLCLKPLDAWLPAIFNQTDFFAFYRPGPDRLISNWFLASTPDSRIPRLWYSASAEFWRMEYPGTRPYFWHHYLFEYLVRTNAEFNCLFEATPKHSAEPPHLLQKALDAGAVSDADLRRISFTVVQKLNHKSDVPLSELKAALDRLPMQTLGNAPGRA